MKRCRPRRSLAIPVAVVTPLALQAATHRLAPTVFFNTYSAAHSPVLRVKSGGRIVTAVADDREVDGRGLTVARGPNPQTGPFFVEGAEPGDLLVVTIEWLDDDFGLSERAVNIFVGQALEYEAATVGDAVGHGGYGGHGFFHTEVTEITEECRRTAPSVIPVTSVMNISVASSASVISFPQISLTPSRATPGLSLRAFTTM